MAEPEKVEPLIGDSWKKNHALAKARDAKLENAKNKVRSTESPVAIFLEVGEPSLWDEMFVCTLNVATAAVMKGIKLDVHVSLITSNSKDSDYKKIDKDLRSINGVDYWNIIQVENRGGDVGQFLLQLQVVQKANKAYSRILKLHTKSDPVWRDRMTESLCGNPEQVISIWNEFNNIPTLGIIAPMGTTFSPNTNSEQIMPHIRRKYNWVRPGTEPTNAFDPITIIKLKEAYKHVYEKNGELNEKHIVIVAGTAFWIKFEAIQAKEIVKALPWLQEGMSKGYKANFGMEHIFERLVPTVVKAHGMMIAEIPPAPRVLAMFFPQYHPIPENDRFWGTNFTEWTLLRPCTISGIRKPLDVSQGGLGYYDLMDIDVRRKQGQMARQAGVTGFVFYHYWFSGSHAPEDHLVMHQMTEQMLLDGEPNVPFVFSWANEPWTKRWSGGGQKKKDHILMSQEYGDEPDWKEHFEYLMKFFRHPNYIFVDRKPCMILYRLGHFGDKLEPMLKYWREMALAEGFEGLHIIHTIGNFYDLDGNTKTLEKHTDGAFHFWPQLMGSGFASLDTTATVHELPIGAKVQYWGSFVGFNRQVRFNKAVPINRSVKDFNDSMHLSFTSMAHHPGRDISLNLYFITAWNEWNEQAVLEPDSTNRFGYLNALKHNLERIPTNKKPSIPYVENERLPPKPPDSSVLLKKRFKKKVSYVVVSYCKGDLSWLNKELSGLDVTNIYIYSKCGHEVQGFPMTSKVKVKVLPNVGRCDHTYAHFLANDLPGGLTVEDGSVFFTTDNDVPHQYGVTHLSLTQLLTAMKRDSFTCRANIVPEFETSKYHLTSLLREFHLPNYKAKGYALGSSAKFSSGYKNLGSWFDSLQLKPELPQPVTPVCYGGSFVARPFVLYKASKEEWGRIADALGRSDSIEEGHFMERIWAGLLSGKKTVFTYPTEYCLNPYYFATSYLGMLCKPEMMHKKTFIVGFENHTRDTNPCRFCNTSHLDQVDTTFIYKHAEEVWNWSQLK